MKLFTVGPVEMYPKTLEIEGKQQPYFRTPEFSTMMKNIEQNFFSTIYAPEGTCFIGLTCSGTGAMEAAVANILTKNDKVLVINGGSFGSRFVDICQVYSIPTETYDIPYGAAFSKNKFKEYNNKGFTALLVNACETSTGQKYDLKYLGQFCKRNHMVFIVDAVSAYLADYINMVEQKIDVLLTASQKALALSPGTSLVAVSEMAYNERVHHKKSLFYFDFNTYIENQKRGQPPFTCSVGTILSLHQRLKNIVEHGVDKELNIHAERARYFREKIKGLPLEIPEFPMSNSCTAILFKNRKASVVYETLKEKYALILTPSGGTYKERQLRVGHLGNLTLADYDYLINKLKEELE